MNRGDRPPAEAEVSRHHGGFLKVTLAQVEVSPVTEEKMQSSYVHGGGVCMTLRRQKAGSAESSWGGVNLLGFLFVNSFKGTGDVFLMLRTLEE